MTDGKEESVDGNVHLFLVWLTLAFHQTSALHTVLSKESQRVVLKEYLDVLTLHHPLLHHL